MNKIEIYTMYRYNIDIQFEWDENKRLKNIDKHGVDFKEAKSVFYDDDALVIIDSEHSIIEERFIILGMSNKARALVVCHCYGKNEKTIRIISARKATSKEIQQYVAKKVTL